MHIDTAKSTSTSTSRSTTNSSPVHVPQDLEMDTERGSPASSEDSDLVCQRTQELCGLLVGYAFALQYVPSYFSSSSHVKRKR